MQVLIALAIVAWVANDPKRSYRGMRAIDMVHRRPDRAMCPARNATIPLDGVHGDVPCPSCRTPFDTRAWPNRALVAPAGVAPIDDAHAPMLIARMRRLKRSALAMNIGAIVLSTPPLIASIFMPTGTAPTWAAAFFFMPALACMFVALHVREKYSAREALLATRPDLWDPLTTHLRVGELERLRNKSGHRRLARRERARLA